MEQNKLQLFTNEELNMNVRIVLIDNEPMFVGKDLVENLGYNIEAVSYSKYIKKECDEEDYILYDKTQVQFRPEFDYKLLGQRGGYLVNESEMYALILGSDLPSAKKFKRWVTKEVLPSIRQTGGYIPTTEEDDEESIMAKALLIAQKTLDKKNKQIEDLTKEKDQLQSTLNKFLSTKGLYDIGTFAKVLDIPKLGRNNMFKWFKTHSYLMSSNEPYQQYMKYFSVKNVEKNSMVVIKTLLKPEGVIYFYKKISQEFNINKTIEQVSKELNEEE